MQLSDAAVATSQQFGDSLAVDLDTSGAPIGVELLMAPACATSAVLSPLLAAFPELSTVRDLLGLAISQGPQLECWTVPS